jgi:MarR family 2-MHQ and catechol resistance regulon transcriptional repressor
VRTTHAIGCGATPRVPGGSSPICSVSMTLRLIPAIHRATHRIGLFLAELREHDLSQGEAHILAHLASSGPATVGELHAGLAHKRSTLTSILDRLVDRGLITRDVGAHDRRTFIIATTARGRKVAAQVHRHLLALEQAIGRRVTEKELRACLTVLAAVEDAAREEVER